MAKGDHGNRVKHLEDVQAAYELYNIEMLRLIRTKDKNNRVEQYPVPIETAGDDLGIYYLIPKLFRAFSLPMGKVFQYFYLVLVFLSYLILSIGFSLLTTNNYKYFLVSLSLLLFSFFTFFMLEVYLFAYLAVSFVPLVIIISQKDFGFKEFVRILLVGLLLGALNVFRSHAPTGVLVFLLSLILFSNSNGMKKVLILIFTGLFFWLGSLWIKPIIRERNSALLASGYEEKMLSGFPDSHIFWHTLFLGLGYENDNPHGIIWKDEYAFMRANFYSKEKGLNYPIFSHLNMPNEYEQVMKNLYVDFIKQEPLFVFSTYLKKCMSLLLKSLLLFPLIILYLKRKFSLKRLLIICLPVVFYSLAGIVAVPHFMFIIGATGLSLVLGLFWWVEE